MNNISEKNNQDFAISLLHWIERNPYIALPLIFYAITAFVAWKTNKSFWQVFFNGRTPRWMMGKKHKEKYDLKNKKEKKGE